MQLYAQHPVLRSRQVAADLGMLAWIVLWVLVARTVHRAVLVLAEPGRQYAVYVHGGTKADLTLDLPKGDYAAEWVDTKTGGVAKAAALAHPGGPAVLASPEYAEDIALRIRAKK